MFQRLLNLFRAGGGDGAPALERRSATLYATSEGAAIAAYGRAEIAGEGDWQRFLVEVGSALEDGSVLTLLLNDLPVGEIVMEGSEGMFEIASCEKLPLPDAIQDIRRIRKVALSSGDGTVVLTGVFDPSGR